MHPLQAPTRVNAHTGIHSSVSTDRKVYFISSREFFLPAPLDPGTVLDFEFKVSSPFAAWRDTLSLQIAAGGDRTPPRLGFLRTAGGATPEFVLPADRALDGGPLRQVEAVITPVQDTTAVVTVPLRLDRDGDAYRGHWTEAPPGRYWVRAAAEDGAGNRGVGILGSFTVPDLDDGPDTPPGFGTGRPDGLAGWEWLGPRRSDWLEPMLNLAVAPADHRVDYLLTAQGLWRSLDRMQTWTRVGLMTGERAGADPGKPHIAVDAEDPATLYFKQRCSGALCASLFARSRDGGVTWQRLTTPNQGVDEDLLAVDPLRGGRLHLLSGGRLWVSDDGGLSWAASRVAQGESPVLALDQVRVLPHPGQHDLVYAASGPCCRDNLFWRSEDGGYTWENWLTEGGFEIAKLALDPRDSAVLYSNISVASYITTNNDGGRGPWSFRYHGDVDGLAVDPLGTLFGWSRTGLQRYDPESERSSPGIRIDLPFTDPGRNTAAVGDLVFVRQEPSAFYVVPASPAQHLWVGLDGGLAWRETLIERGIPPVSSLWIGQEETVAAAGRITSDGQRRPALFVRDGAAGTWRERPVQIAVEDGFFEAFHRDPQAPQFSLAHAGDRLFWSADGGRSWRQILDLPSGARLDFLPDTNQPGVYYIGVGAGRLYRSADFGATWAETGQDLPATHGAAFALDSDSPGALLALAEGQLWRSDDNGRTWSQVGSVDTQLPLLRLAIAPHGERALYAVDQRRLYRSRDHGSTWAVVLESGPHAWQRPLLRFRPGDPETVYFATARRLYLSRDRGRSWRALIGTEASCWPWINDVAADPANPDLLYAATAQGAYRIDVRARTATVAQDLAPRPQQFALDANYPNPFNGSTSIRFAVPTKSRVTLSVYNTVGQKIADLVDAEEAAGHHTVAWNGRDAAGQPVASGVYLYRLRSTTYSATRKLLLLR